MAISNKNASAQAVGEVKAPREAQSKGAKTSANAKMLQEGNAILATFSEEQRSQLGSMSGTLHFKHLLGLASQKSQRRVSQNENVDCSTPVGVVLVSDVDIEVPVIPVTKNKDTGIEAEDISFRKVKAGEEFDLTYYEFMFLIVREEYAGFLEANGDPRGAYFSPKLPAYFNGKAKLPTPTINLVQGAAKASMVDIDVKGPNGWEIKPEYKEKYGDLLVKARPQRQAGTKSSTPSPTVIAVALSKILKDATGGKA